MTSQQIITSPFQSSPKSVANSFDALVAQESARAPVSPSPFMSTLNDPQVSSSQLFLPSPSMINMGSTVRPSFGSFTFAYIGRSSGDRSTLKKKILCQGSKRNRRFLILVHILSMNLEKSHRHDLKLQVKRLIQECNRLHRAKDPRFSDLQRSVEALLRSFLGDTVWNAACRELETKLIQRKQLFLLME